MAKSACITNFIDDITSYWGCQDSITVFSTLHMAIIYICLRIFVTAISHPRRLSWVCAFNSSRPVRADNISFIREESIKKPSFCISSKSK
mmetsp:Transcript_17672/g.37120  ORF Transcript_17672/g.37120 Transcript_17672/m.37120 type:complete len:90 (+) Transcript_17672:166-435(+)